ncbi:MAG: ctpA [Candidatus Taylorbacteria bacterium]|nr:ctpA [Candidatus Taylorbacteria bacterium]
MQENTKANGKKIEIWAVVIIVIGIAFGIGYYSGNHSGGPAIAHPAAEKGGVVTDEQFDTFWKVWKLLDDKYVTAASSTSQDKIWGAIKGLAASEGDPYTVFFPPEDNTLFKEEISGNFQGVGMEIGLKDNTITVVAPIKNSPAERAGVKSGDKVVKINDTPTIDFSVEKAVKMIRGAKGTIVKLTIVRDGVAGVIEKSIARDIIDVPTIDTETKDGVFIIRLYSFTAQSANLFRGALREFVSSGNNKLVLDLRGNPGGYLDAAWDMASWFLPAGKVVVTEDFGGKQDPNVFRSKGYNIFNSNLHMAILVNEGSASAAEILAGALHEHGIAKLVGTKTFGKGSVQELIPVTSNTSLKVTIARWLTPLGHNLSHDGLVPDFEVKIDPKTTAEEFKKNDPQLKKAIEILTK